MQGTVVTDEWLASNTWPDTAPARTCRIYRTIDGSVKRDSISQVTGRKETEFITAFLGSSSPSFTVSRQSKRSLLVVVD